MLKEIVNVNKIKHAWYAKMTLFSHLQSLSCNASEKLRMAEKREKQKNECD